MEDQYFYILLFFLSVELTVTSSNYNNDNTQQDQNRKLVLGIRSPSDTGHMVFSSQKYGGKTIQYYSCNFILSW